MNEVIEFFQKLFSDEGFMPRWICGRWSGFNGWLYISGDLLTGTAYMAIPTLILRFVHGQKITYFRTLYYLFPAFIILCGSTHFANMVMFWVPVYRLGALLALVTGVVSWITVVYIYKSLPFAISMTPRSKLEEEILLRKEAENQLRAKALELNERTEQLQIKNEQLERFAYIASHDLAEPLRKISIFSDKLEQARGGMLTDTEQQYFEKIRDSAGRMGGVDEKYTGVFST